MITVLGLLCVTAFGLSFLSFDTESEASELDDEFEDEKLDSLNFRIFPTSTEFLYDEDTFDGVTDDLEYSADSIDDEEQGHGTLSYISGLLEGNSIGVNQEMVGNDLDNAIVGSERSDHLIGLGGEDLLQGGLGDDILDGRSGESFPMQDVLRGGSGDDLLVGGESDALHGGLGSDIFFLDASQEISQPATISDFSMFEDSILIGYDSDEEIPDISLEAEGNNTQLFVGDKVTIILEGIVSTEDVVVSLVGV